MDEIKEFVEQYVSYDSNNEEYVIDAFTGFIYFDKKLVDKDIDKIRDFLFSHVYFREGICSIYWLLFDPENKQWNELKNLRDLRALNEVYSLAIATGVIKNNFQLRFLNYANTRNRHVFYNPEEFNLSDQEVALRYFDELRDQVLPRYNIDVDVSIKKQYIHPALADDSIRNVIRYWWDAEVEDATVEEEDTFNCLVELNPNDVLNVMTYLAINNFGSKGLLEEIRNGRGRDLIDHTNEYIKSLSAKDFNNFNRIKARMINELLSTIKEPQKTRK